MKMNFIKKHGSNVLFGCFIILLIIPQTRMPIQVFLQRTISLSPSEILKEDRIVLKSYNWNLIDTTSKSLNLKQSKGSVILINYWATWCPPCIAEMPAMQNLYDLYGNQVDFYFITNDYPNKVSNYLKTENYKLPVYFQAGKSPVILESNSLPTTFLLSKEGEIVMKKVGAARWNASKVHHTIDKLLME